jgi:hypothetical protein
MSVLAIGRARPENVRVDVCYRQQPQSKLRSRQRLHGIIMIGARFSTTA